MSATLIIGGCRSGKSDQALLLAGDFCSRRNIFIATCVARDREMQQRVARHRLKRGAIWQTVETAIDLVPALEKHTPADVIVVDCLTLWASNLMEAGLPDQEILELAAKLGLWLEQAVSPVFLVTNEVGAGIVPENRLARRFRDLAGEVNSIIAGHCRKVVWMVAGIPVTIKDGN